MKMQRLDLLLVNQSTTYLFKSLCDRIAAAFPEKRIALLTGSFEQTENEPAYRVIQSVQLVRDSSWKRLTSWSLFSLRFLFLLIWGRPRFVLVTTNPPFCPWICGLVNIFLKRPYMLSVYDLYPDVLDRMGIVREKSLLYRLLNSLNRRSLRKASAVITLAEDMAAELQKHATEPTPRIRVIPNWADTRLYRPVAKSENPFVLEHQLEESFIVMYSGAFGATHDMDSMLKAASLVSDLPQVVFVLVGKGSQLSRIQESVARLNLPNVRLLPWQPIEMVSMSLAAADCHIVTLDGPYAGISFPSKFYTSIAVGSAILALAPAETDLAKIVKSEGIGKVVQPRDAKSMAEAIRDLNLNAEGTRHMQYRSRQLAEGYYDEATCTGQYIEILHDILNGKQN